ncbi:MAG: toxin-antitoxin system HicB family antitoxin [Myxococcales bacterium]|nr:toxin-antitoxin system HicB family antitoxin [Myxococcales bacterium]
MKLSDKYTYRVQWSEADGEFVGLCAEFPSLSWLGKTDGEAFRGIKKLVRDVLADMARSGEAAPEPLGMRQYSGVFKVRIPPNLHRRLAVQAAESGVSLNRLVSLKLAE